MLANSRGWKAALLLIFTTFSFFCIIKPARAAVTAQITGTNPPSGVTVEAGSVFPLAVGVSYSVPPETAKQVGGYVLWLTVDGKTSNLINFAGPGSHTFQFSIQASPTPGTYTMKISLYILTKPDYQQSLPGQLRDTATFTYTVKPKVATDWEVERVWITPESPTPGEEVSFHARIALRSTTSTQSLIVEVMCQLDNQQFLQTLMTISFKPTPSSQDVMVPKRWEAAEGEHELRFTVDPLKKHTDPNLQNNIRSFRFRVEPFYAVIHDIKNPRIVDPGETFEVAVGVDYKFPDNTQLRISNSFPVNDTAEEQFDTVIGEGINAYTYSVTAPTPPPARPGESDLMGYNGSAWVEYDRGSGWQHTDPGWMAPYGVMVRRPTYYAVFDSVDASYMGPDEASGSNISIGRFSMTFQVRYLLPLETGLRLIVYGFNGSSEVLRVEESIIQSESTERTITYTHEFTFPIMSLREGSYTIGFDASVDYMVEGAWYHGDDGSAISSVTVYYPVSEVAASRTILDDIKKIFEDFLGWLREIFRLIIIHGQV